MIGFGDALMAAGLAEEEFKRDSSLGPVAVRDLSGRPRWHYIWEHNPAITSATAARSVTCGAGCLPYVRRVGDRLIFSSTYRAFEHRGHLHLTDDELAHPRSLLAQLPRVKNSRRPASYIVVEPHGTDRKNINRQWPIAYWQVVADHLLAAGHTVVQCDYPEANRLAGVHLEPVANFRDSCSIFASATLVITTEGGVPFGCQAVGQSSVLALWGGAVSAECLAFPEHTNLVGTHNGCGSLRACDECADMWDALTPDHVTITALNLLTSLLATGGHRGIA